VQSQNIIQHLIIYTTTRKDTGIILSSGSVRKINLYSGRW